MPLTVFPSTPVPQFPLDLTPQWKTTISSMESGINEQRTQRWRFPRRTVNLSFAKTKAADMPTLWNYYQARKGSKEAFWFVLPDSGPVAFTDEYVGRGTGAATVFDLSGTTTSSRTIYVDGVEVTTVTYQTGTGDAGADQVTFTSNTPALGALITCDFTGYLRLRMRFLHDSLKRSFFNAEIYALGIDLIEARIE